MYAKVVHTKNSYFQPKGLVHRAKNRLSHQKCRFFQSPRHREGEKVNEKNGQFSKMRNTVRKTKKLPLSIKVLGSVELELTITEWSKSTLKSV